MSAPKHTPAPWTVFYKHKYDEWHVSVPVNGCGFKLALFADGCPTGEADARLVAAAPDLLAELKSLVGFFEGAGFKTNFLADARAAISKAEGEHQ